MIILHAAFTLAGRLFVSFDHYLNLSGSLYYFIVTHAGISLYTTHAYWNKGLSNLEM